MSEVTPPATARIPVCGIGAGGIDALQQFFRDLPPSLGLAYIVMVHVDGEGAGDPATVLGRSTQMRVVRVADENHRLSADHVYVVTADRKVEVGNDTVSASVHDGERRTAIDVFFRDLAFSHGDGFAVVLSGAGSDGAVGAKAVKERGGLVLVQDPDDAADGSMPRATVATGLADVVLPVGALVRRFIDLARAKRQLSPSAREPEQTAPISDEEDAALTQVLDVVRARTGHDFSGYKRGTVLRRLSRRLQLTGRLTIRDYLGAMHENAAETQALFDDLLISVTTFFRDPAAWESLRTHAVAPLVAQASTAEPVRVWVPGCATGEEAYTVAMLFLEEFERQGTSAHLTIFASDSDPGALAIARNGLYPRAISTDVSDGRLARYFRHDGEHYQVTSTLREHVVFALHNVLRDPPFARLHLLSCRNVLIYLGGDLQEGVTGTFRYACREDGYLFLDASETVRSDLFEAVDAQHRVFRARGGVRGQRPPIGELRVPPRGRVPRGSQAAPSARAVTPLERHLETLEEVAPPSALLDDRWNVQHLSASAGRFLQQSAGPLAERITELVRPELRNALHTILLQTADDREAHAAPPILVQFDGTVRRVVMIAQPRAAGNAERADLLVTFIDAGRPDGDVIAAPDADDGGSGSLSGRLHAAEQRLDNVQEDALSTTEELLTANEELQSLNEEYRSTTEELETSREELQSTNEELHAANEELKLKVQEVSRARSDVENLMRATNVATLFLNRDLRIKRFTTELAAIFPIKARDLERPIGDLRHTLDYPGFEDDARHALESEVAVERQVSSGTGRVYIARVSPYRTADDNAVDGVVATFVDVTAIKTAEENLRKSERRLEAELTVARRLHGMTLDVASAQHLHDGLGQLVVAAVDLHGADQCYVQVYDRAFRRLEIVAQQGGSAAFVEQFASIGVDKASVFGHMLRTGTVVQSRDVLAAETDAAFRRIAGQAGARAVQLTPLLDRDGDLLGVLSVLFRDPHDFSERDLQLSALLGRQTADLLEARAQRLAISASRLETSEVRDLLRRLVTVQEEERRRIARDLHDQLGQSMTAMRMQIEALRRWTAVTPELIADVDRIDRLAQDLDGTIDFLTWELRPAALDRLGLSAALKNLVQSWSERFDMAADFHAQGPVDRPLPNEVAVNLYRILQEALHNVHKHAAAARVSVLFAVRDSEAMMVIEDDGCGFTADAPTAPDRRGLGLVSMRERTLLIDGTLDIETAPGRGTAIFVRVPIDVRTAVSSGE
jgi:two-component system CheB/CheR fusion protein